MRNEKENIISIKKVNILGLLLFHSIFALTTFIDKADFLDETTGVLINTITYNNEVIEVYQPVYDLGLDYKNGSTNTFFLGAVSFWANLFILSLMPFFLCIYAFRKWYYVLFTSGLPAYFGFILFRAIENADTTQDLIVPNLNIFIYCFLFFCIGVILLKTLRINHSFNREKRVKDLESKLLTLNLEGKEISQEDYFKALNYAIKGCSMDNVEERNKYLQKCLNSVNILMKDLDKK